jgi:hypothetical protein
MILTVCMQHDFAAGPANNKVSGGRIVGGSLVATREWKTSSGQSAGLGANQRVRRDSVDNSYDYDRLALLRLPCSKTVHLTKKAEAVTEALVQRDFSSLMP